MKTSSKRGLLALGAALALLGGCASRPAQVARNAPACPPGTLPTQALSPALMIGTQVRCTGPGADAPLAPTRVPRARDRFEEQDRDLPEQFIGVAISGGGSRAAVFGMRALRELSRLGILDHVSAVSTTSGGGLPGAYYALNARFMNWDAAEDAMARDYLAPWIGKNLDPIALFSVIATEENRSDLMAAVFDELFVDGHTYGDLGEFRPGTAPIWLANATEIGHVRRFTFAEREFARINSALAPFPISQAVMASAAFPGVFNSVTLRHFATAYQPPAQGGKAAAAAAPPQVRYKHLIDGGPTDNLGIEALLGLATSHERALRAQGRAPASAAGTPAGPGRCLLVVVDAHPRGVPSRFDHRPDLRGPLGRFIDLNFLEAIDALMEVRRADLLGYVGLRDPGMAGGAGRGSRVVHFDVPLAASRLGQVRPVGGDAPRLEAQPVPADHFRCAAWHIGLGHLESLQQDAKQQPQQDLTPELAAALEEQLGLHQHLVSQVATNFRLAGPAQCSPELIRASLQEAATLLVREDGRHQRMVCDWLKGHGLKVDASCGQPRPIGSLARLPLQQRVLMKNRGTPGGFTEEVECVAVK